MKKLYFLLASTLVFVLLAGAGCQSSDTPAETGDSTTTTTEKPADAVADNNSGGGGDHVGTWTLVISEDMKTQFEGAKKAGGVPEDAKLPQMSFTLKGDGTCSMAGDFDGTRYEAKGTYKVEGGNIVITPTESFVNGEPDPNANNEPVTLTWSADKTMLESTDPGEKMQFKKG